MIVLYEGGIYAGLFNEPAPVETLVEKAALIAKYFWFNDQDAGKSSFD